MPVAITEEQLALQASIRDWASRAGTLELVRGLELDPSRARGGESWRGLADLGVFSIALPAEAALTLCGPDGAAADGAAAGAVHEFLLSRCLSIAGGTTQILLSVVAERELGLPRTEAR